MTNKKSDVVAKKRFVEELKNRGYNARVVSSPADIIAEKNGAVWYYEIKMTHQNDKYFGAATLTEWKQAFADPEHFRFVIVIANEGDTEFEFREYTPEEFMEFSTIPPFKIFFNVTIDGSQPKRKASSKAIRLDKRSFEILRDCFNKLGN